MGMIQEAIPDLEIVTEDRVVIDIYMVTTASKDD